jgi:hypothetical protein
VRLRILGVQSKRGAMADYQEYQDYDEYYDEPSGGNRTWLVVAIVIVVVLLCCCCLALVAGIWLFGEDILDGLQALATVFRNLPGMTARV